jgi:hypothetical protein
VSLIEGKRGHKLPRQACPHVHSVVIVGKMSQAAEVNVVWVCKKKVTNCRNSVSLKYGCEECKIKKITQSLVTTIVSTVSYKGTKYEIVGKLWMTVSVLDKGNHKSLRHGSHLSGMYYRTGFKNYHAVNIVTFYEVRVQYELSVQTFIEPMQWNHNLWPLHSINYDAILRELKKRRKVCHLKQSHAMTQRAISQWLPHKKYSSYG